MAKRKKKKRRKPKKQLSGSYLSEALTSLRQGDINAASNLASRVVQLTNKVSEVEQAQRILEEIHFRNAVNNQDLQKKLTDLTVTLKASPKDNRLHFHRGIALLQTGKAAEALKEFDLIAKTEPEREGLAYFRQLACLASKKTLGKAQNLSAAEANTLKLIKEFQKRPSEKVAGTIPEMPLLGNPEMWNMLLKMRHNKKFTPTEQLKELATTDTPKPVSAILQYYQGIAAMREDNLNAARDLWQKALSKGVATKWSQKNLGLCIRQEFLDLVEAKRWDEIVNKFRRLPSTLNDKTLNQIVSLTFFHLGYAQAEKNKWKQAIKHWTEAAQKANNQYLAQNMALAREQLGQWARAADAWREMLRRKPRKQDHPDYLTDKQVATVWEHVVVCYLNAHMEEDAIDCLYKAVEYDSGNLTLRFKLVSMLMAEGYGDTEAAAGELKNILKVDPNNIEALTQLAHIYQDWEYDTIHLWKKIVELEPENTEARGELAQSYIKKVMPEDKPGGFFGRRSPYKQQLEVLQEGLEVLPDHPDLVAALGIVHTRAKKKKQAKEQFLRVYQLAPQDTHLVSLVLQNLIRLKENKPIEEMIPEIRTIPGLLPGFWVDQGTAALHHPSWARRFFDEALEQLNYTDKTTKAGVLVDIYLCIPPGRQHQAFRDTYMQKIKQEVPQSGALEYLEGYTLFSQTHNIKKARRLIQKAKKLAAAAKDTGVLQHIEVVENLLSTSPVDFINTLLRGMDEEMLEELIEEMEGFDDGDFF